LKPPVYRRLLPF